MPSSIHPDLQNRVIGLKFAGIILLALGLLSWLLALGIFTGVLHPQEEERTSLLVLLVISGVALAYFAYRSGYEKRRWFRRATWVIENVQPVEKQIKLLARDDDSFAFYFSISRSSSISRHWCVEISDDFAPEVFLILGSRTKLWVLPPSPGVFSLIREDANWNSGTYCSRPIPALVYADPQKHGPIVIRTSEGILWPSLEFSWITFSK